LIAVGLRPGRRENVPVGHLADAAEVLPLDAGRFAALLEGTGHVEDAHRPHGIGRQVGNLGAHFPLDGVGQALVVPQAGLEKLLQIARRNAGVLSERLGRLPRQVGEQARA
jgi:hypothetical protein